MKKTGILFGVASAAILMMSSCNNGPTNGNEQKIDPALEEPATGDDNMHIDYTAAEHFLVRPSYTGTLNNPKIETKAKFDSIFYCTHEHPEAVEVDFDKNYVIAVVAPNTNTRNTVKPISLRKSEPNEVVLTYRWESGTQQPDSTRSSLALIVKKEHDGTVILNESR
ncbi:hypothetical protein ACFSQ3_03685 [Sphingobacterium corticis]|uniref:Lipoprotein n=1 Tax=Sphingobacterium corticis TaxID=1812823 RepID=A0ABW5NG20_9SPHI